MRKTDHEKGPFNKPSKGNIMRALMLWAIDIFPITHQESQILDSRTEQTLVTVDENDILNPARGIMAGVILGMLTWLAILLPAYFLLIKG